LDIVFTCFILIASRRTLTQTYSSHSPVDRGSKIDLNLA